MTSRNSELESHVEDVDLQLQQYKQEVQAQMADFKQQVTINFIIHHLYLFTGTVKPVMRRELTNVPTW